jgi:hypothetical protein
MVLGLAAANVACTVPDKRHPGVRRRSRRSRTDSVSFSQQRSVTPALEEDEGLRLQVGTDAVVVVLWLGHVQPVSAVVKRREKKSRDGLFC